ncbi:2-hydroxyacid dehydrogenase [Virgibacillus oceani]|uniref:D-glycerate dehydrogenase n=1 Tax=Virgibacillus oceani TaxID=1479511 RepID=A0A917H4C5_9BACI|nr:D-glycerate dehydrogenase [Virgibacillus oceani]GGG66363.1 D-glycerate dehydrogenase [Virgibacillus oceani]
MNKPLVYITRKIPNEIVEPFRELFEFRMWEEAEEPVPRDRLIKEMEQADALLCLLTETIDRELLESAVNLKIVANMAVGYDNIDVNTARDKGITVTNTPDVLTNTTADLTFALLMAAARKIVEGVNFIKKDKWEHWSPFLLAGSDIHHKTIGIVGMGRIGKAVAKRAKGFDMEVLYHNRSRNLEAEQELQAIYTDFDKLLERSDFIVSLVPLTNETKHMFDRTSFQKMKSRAIFINVSRGQVVDETALYHALESNEIAAAGLDVFEKEPIRADHPLLELDNVVCLPHIGSASIETRVRMLELCLENILLLFNGEEPKTPV